MTKPPSYRIVLVSAFPPGRLSLSEYGFHFAKGLAACDDVSLVIVLADQLPEPLVELDLGPKIEVRRVWRFNGIATLPRLLREVCGARADTVVFNLQTATFGDREVPAALGLLTPAMTRLLGVRSGVIAHNIIAGVDLEQTLLKGQKLRQAMVRAGGALVTAAMMRASYVTTTLQAYVDILLKAHPKANLHLVPHGTFDTTERPWRTHASRKRQIATMGKFGTYKRLETLLAAFDLLRQAPEFADITLMIGGSDHPNASGYMSGLAAARKDDAGVVFQGYVAEDAIPEFFEAALISVFDYESTTGSSGVLHQTVTYGAVPVFPHIGDFVEISLDEGLKGYNYAPGIPSSMASAIKAVLRDPDAAEAVAKSNRKAAVGIPFSQVIDFHVAMIAEREGGG